MTEIRADVDVRAVTADRWPELERFFGPSGAYSNCWCTFFRLRAKDFQAGCREHSAGNREILRRLTAEGAVPGLLAYRDDEPVGWVSIAPREQFVRVTNSTLLRPPDVDTERDVWSIVCFWTPRGNRGQGIGAALLDGALSYAYDHGAKAVEGYPVDVSKKWVGAAGIYHGTVGQFERAGFVAIRRPSEQRAVMRHEQRRKSRTPRQRPPT
jgi:GNAT superfamily N-acetyltransferase